MDSRANRCRSLRVVQPPGSLWKSRLFWSPQWLSLSIYPDIPSRTSVNPDLCIPSFHSHPPLHIPLCRRLQEPRRDHRSATRQQGLRNCQTQGGLSVREDQSLCKPLRHSTLHNTSPRLTGTLCLQPFCLVEKVMWVKRRKTDGGVGVEGGKGKKGKKTSVRLRPCTCTRKREYALRCVKCESDCSKSGGIWRPHSIPISRSFLR